MRKQAIYTMLIAVVLLLLTGCAAFRPVTLQETYPRMYSEQPVTVLILPPVNNTTSVDAKEYFACSLSEAIGLKGYYPLPVETVFDILRDQGLYDTESYTSDLAAGNPVIFANLKKHFGVDAVLFSTIEKWNKSWFLTNGWLDIDARFELLSTADASNLWDFRMSTQVTLGSGSENLIVAALESAVKTALEDYFPHARRANIHAMDKALPFGKHHPEWGTDAENEIPADKHGVWQISR